MDYSAFLHTKNDYGASSGFEPLYMPSFLFDFQVALTDWAIRKGRAAIFADCGLGKTPMQLVWAQNVLQHTNKPVLILTPLSVAQQTLEEAEKFSIEAVRAPLANHPHKVINVTNYQKLHYFNADDYGGIVLDESSILKNESGAYRALITEFMRQIPYRLLATATAAPNDWDELGTSSEALGYLGYMDMLKTFFINKENSSHNRRAGRWERGFDANKFHLRGWAEVPFWKWVASWSRAVRKPSDMGFEDDGFVLPELIENYTEIEPLKKRDGYLIDIEAINWFEQREVTKRSLVERCEAAAEKVAQHDISSVWCNLNDEGALLKRMIPNSIEISGKDSDERKEDAVHWFRHGEDSKRVLISKAKIFGLGLNFQHCRHAVVFPSFSYEQYYQIVRRFWRFGQTGSVIVDNIFPKGGERMMNALQHKSEAADKMFDNLVAQANDARMIEREQYNSRKIEVPTWL